MQLAKPLIECHLAPNTHLIGVSTPLRPRNCAQHRRQQATSGICSRSSTTAAAAAGPPQRGWHADYVNGLGALLRRNQLTQAVELVDSCLDSRRRIHGVATGELLEALCAAGQHSTAWALLRRITASQGRLPLLVLHRLLKLAGQFGTVDDVLAVYQHQQQLYGFASANVQTTLVHALLKAHSKAQPGQLLAYEAWGRLKNSGQQLDAQSLLAGVHACVCVGKFRQAEALLESLKAAAGAAGRPMVSAYNLLLKGHVAADNLDAARRAFGAMSARGLSPDAVTFNTLISGFVRRGDVASAQSLLRRMRGEGVQPDAWTYTTLALGYGRQGQMAEMRGVVQEMQQAGVTPNSALYSAAIDALASTGQLQEAGELLQQLLHNQPDVYATLGSSSSSSSSNAGDGNSGRRPAAAAAGSEQVSTQQTQQREPQTAAGAAHDFVPNSEAAASEQQQTAHSLSASYAAQVETDPAAAPAVAAAAAAAAEKQRIHQAPAVRPAAAGAVSSDGTGFSSKQQQQQQRQDIAGATRNREQVLRQQYNSLIKGWLQLAAAQASEQAEQLWLLKERESSSSSSGSSTPVVGASVRDSPALQGAASSSNGTSAGGNSSPQQVAQPPRVAAVSEANAQAAVQVPLPAPPPPPPARPSLSSSQQQQQQQQLLPAVQRAGVGLVRPVLPPQSPVASGEELGPSGSSSSFDAAAGRQPPQQQQQQQQQQGRQPSGVAASGSNSNGTGKAEAEAAAAAASTTVTSSSSSSSSVTSSSGHSSEAFNTALAVLQQMQAAGVAPGADTYTFFVSYCIKVRDAALLQRMLDAATAAGVVPDQVLLTSLVKAAWQADAHGAAVDVFNALLRVTGPPNKRGSSSSTSSSGGSSSGGSSGGSSAAARQSGGSSDGNGSADGAAAAASSGNTGAAARAPQLQQQRLSLAQSLRAYARAAVDATSEPPSGRTQSTPTPADAAAVLQAGAQEQQPQQAAMQAELEAQLQQQVAQARQQQQQRSDGGLGSDPWDLPPAAWQPQQQQDQDLDQQQQQQPPRRPSTQLLLPLSAPIGPDTAAWNALVAALVRAGQLDDAAAALERSTQASAAAGACRPPVEGYSALIRGYRRSGLKHKAVGLLRQFLNLGGRPGRVMCDDVITLCLEARDVKTARQVVRAMELTGCLDADRSAFYDGWFQRWELQQQMLLLPRHLQQSAAGTGSRGATGARPGGSSSSGSSSQLPAAVPGSSGDRPPVAVERLKWWLGLPNSYYRGEGESQVGAGGAGGGPPPSSSAERGRSDGRDQQ